MTKELDWKMSGGFMTHSQTPFSTWVCSDNTLKDLEKKTLSWKWKNK